MRRVIADVKLVADKVSDPAPRPDRAAKAKGFRTLLQQTHQLGALGLAQQRLRAGGRVSPQGRHAIARGAAEPLTHRSVRDTECFGDLALLPAVLMEFPGTAPTTFVPTQSFPAIGCAHGPEHSTSWPTIIRSLCSHQ